MIIVAAFTYYAIVKYSILIILELETFKSYRWIDCYLVGRYIVTERSSQAAKYLAWLIAFVHVDGYLALFVMRPKIRYECLEFLMLESNFQRRAQSNLFERRDSTSPTTKT